MFEQINIELMFEQTKETQVPFTTAEKKTSARLRTSAPAGRRT
jgi:hypothetical protein